MPSTQIPRNSTLPANPSCRRWHHRLTQGVDLGIASTVLLAPLFMGGRGPVGRLVFVLCVAITTMLWCARQCLGKSAAWRKSGAEVLLLAGLGLLLLQLVPLPQSILNLLSPHISEMLPLWMPQADATFQLGTWNQVSLHPVATQAGLATYLAYAALFLLVFQRFESRRDVERLLRLIAVATCVMALLGLAQFLFSNGKFLWVFEHVSRDTEGTVKGPFQNQNHFAHLLALGVGPLLWWIASLQSNSTRRRSRDFAGYLLDPAVQTQVLWLGLGLVTFAALLTFSRGGVVATLLAAATSVALLSWKRIFSQRGLMVVAAIACSMIASLSIHGYKPLADKLGTFRESQSVDELSHGRWALWNADFQAISNFWLLGTGVGTHRDIYPTYLAEYFGVEFTHGECGYLQTLLEAGVLGAGLLLVGLHFAFRWSTWPLLRDDDRATVACAAAIVPGVLASVVHSLGDFVWYIPACMTTTILLLAAACYLYRSAATAESSSASRSEMPRPDLFFAPRLSWIGISVLCVVAIAQATSSLVKPASAAPRWYEHQRLAKTTIGQPLDPAALVALAASAEVTVAANPNDSRAHAQLAGLYLQQFDVAQQRSQNPMPLSQIRDAALASRFASKKHLDDWLDIAVGENRRLFDSAREHAMKSVRLCPLNGEAYALLARVAFLEGPNADRKHQYVQQALLVRPFHSRVRFVAGQESLLDGNVEDALVHWKMAFHGEQEVQDELIHELATVIPAKELIEAMAPDARGLDALFKHYSQIAEHESAKVVATHYITYLIQRSRRDPDFDKLSTLKKLSGLHEYLNSPEEAIRFAREASGLSPSDFGLRLQLGRLLIGTGQFEEAEVELQWCARRDADNAEIHNLLATAKRGSLTRQADASTVTSDQPVRQ